MVAKKASQIRRDEAIGKAKWEDEKWRVEFIWLTSFLKLQAICFFCFRLSSVTLSCFRCTGFWSTEEVLMRILTLDVLESSFLVGMSCCAANFSEGRAGAKCSSAKQCENEAKWSEKWRVEFRGWTPFTNRRPIVSSSLDSRAWGWAASGVLTFCRGRKC